MRNFAFRIAYWAATLFFAVLATPLAFLPSRRPMTMWIRLYAKTMLALMRHVAGIRVEVRGLDVHAVARDRVLGRQLLRRDVAPARRAVGAESGDDEQDEQRLFHGRCVGRETTRSAPRILV